MAANKIYIQVDFQSQSANQAITALNKNLSGIGNAANQATIKASAGIDGLTSSMLQAVTGGNLLSSAIQTALGALKQFTVDAVIEAAQVERMTMATEQLARAYGVSAEAVQQYSEAIQQLNIEDDKAIELLNQMALAGLNLAKTPAIAKIGKDLSELTGAMDAAAAAKKIIDAIDFGSARGLRELGLRVDFDGRLELAELKLGHALSESTKQQIRWEEIQRAAAKASGASAAAADTLSKSWENLATTFRNMRQEFGKVLLPELKEEVKVLDAWLKLTQGIGGTFHNLGALASAKTQAFFGNKKPLEDLDKKLQELRNATPQAETGGGIAGASKKDENLDAKRDALKEQQELAKRVAEATKQARASEVQALDQVKDAQREYTKFLSEQALSRIHLQVIEADAIEQAAIAREQALKAHRDEIAKINEAERREIEERSQYIDEKGKVQRFQLSREALVNIHNAALAKIAAANIKFGQEETQREEAIFQAQVERLQTLYAISQTIAEKRAQRDQQLLLTPLGQQVYEFTEGNANKEKIDDQIQQSRLRAVEQRAELELAMLEQVNAVTVAQKIAVEKRKTEIEVQAIRDREAIELQSIDTTTQRQIAAAQAAAIAAGNFNKEFHERLAKQLTELGQLQKDEIIKGSVNAIAVAQAKMAGETQRIIMDQNKAIYDNLKDQAGRVFDALLQKSTSVWQAMANVFKTTILTAIREIVTSQVARTLYQLFNPGSTVTFGPRGVPIFSGGGAGGGGGGRPLTPLGFVVPQYASTSAVTAPYNPNAASVQSQVSLDREMGPDLYNLPTRASAGPGTLWGQISGAKGPSTASQIRESFNIGKTIRTSTGSTIPWSAASPSQRMGAVLKSPGFAAMAATVGLPVALAGFQRSGLMGDVMAVGGAALAGYGVASMFGMAPLAGAAIGAGAGLFARGLQRGGVKGLLMTTGGGALAGAAISTQLGFGPVPGLIIGAAVGAAAGTIRLFIKNADEKVRDKVRTVYGVDIRDRAIRQQIVDIAKQNYGGNLDVAIRSREVMELVQLYSLVSGQQSSRMPRPMYPATFAQSGAGLQMQPVYSGGQLVSNPYTGTTTTQAMQPPPNMFIQLDPRQANDLFEGRVVNAVQNNPEVVAQSNASATRSGSSRIAQRSNLLEPLTVTS